MRHPIHADKVRLLHSEGWREIPSRTPGTPSRWEDPKHPRGFAKITAEAYAIAHRRVAARETHALREAAWTYSKGLWYPPTGDMDKGLLRAAAWAEMYVSTRQRPVFNSDPAVSSP